MKKTSLCLEKLRLGVLPGPKPVVLVSCGTMQKPNLTAVSYANQVATGRFSISLRPSRLSHFIIQKTKDFTVNFPTPNMVKEADFCGLVSGRKANKFEKTSLTLEKARYIQAPLVEECPLNLECRLETVINLETHDLFIGKVLAVHSSDKESLGWIVHHNFEYFATGKRLGTLFKEGKAYQ